MFEVFGFYKFKKLISLNKNKLFIQDFLIKKGIRGTVIIAKEGLNGTISGKTKDIRDAINKIKKIFSIIKKNSLVVNMLIPLIIKVNETKYATSPIDCKNKSDIRLP